MVTRYTRFHHVGVVGQPLDETIEGPAVRQGRVGVEPTHFAQVGVVLKLPDEGVGVVEVQVEGNDVGAPEGVDGIAPASVPSSCNRHVWLSLWGVVTDIALGGIILWVGMDVPRDAPVKADAGYSASNALEQNKLPECADVVTMMIDYLSAKSGPAAGTRSPLQPSAY